MSRTSTAETEAVQFTGRLELMLADVDLDTPLRRALGRARCVPGDWPTEVTLIATRRPFGWTLSARAAMPVLGGGYEVGERVLHHETLSRAGVAVLVDRRDLPVGHPCETLAAYRWLAEADDDRQPAWSVGRRTTLPMHRARRALEHFRLRALETAEARARGRVVDERSMAKVPPALWDGLLEAIDVDASGRVAELVIGHLAFLHALGAALGDAPTGWVADGELTVPLRLVAAGYRERDVLAAAIEFGLGLPATDERLSRLQAVGAASVKHYDRSAAACWAYLGASLDAPCNVSWLSEPEAGIARWARAQCWASARGLPVAARRYVARYGGAIAAEFTERTYFDHLSAAFEEALRAHAATLLRERVTPYALLRRAARGPLPAWPGMSEFAEANGVTVRRVATGRQLTNVGRRFRNCLERHERLFSYLKAHPARQYFVCEWASGAAIAELKREGSTTTITSVLGPRNAPVTAGVRAQIVATLRAAVPTLEDDGVDDEDAIHEPYEVVDFDDLEVE